MKDTTNEFYSHIEPAEVLSADEAMFSSHSNFPVKNNESIFSEEEYAQELYKLYTGYELAVPTVDDGDILTGEVTELDYDKVTLDVGYKFPIYVVISKEGDNREDLRSLKLGDEVEVYITELIKAGRYTTAAYGSVAKLKSEKTLRSIQQSISDFKDDDDSNQFFDAKIIELIDGGFLVDIDGNTAFLPGSLAAPNKITNFEDKIGETVRVAPISYSDGKKYMVVSHKEYIKLRIPELIEELDVNDTEYTGTVTGSTKFGVFVEFNEFLTGMIHVSELDDKTAKAHEQRSLNPGTEVSFIVKEVTKSNRIILSQKDPVENPWNNFSITIPSTAETIVKGVRNYGIFLEFVEHPGIVGLLHISEMPDTHPSDYNEGDLVEVAVTKVDPHAEKVFFSMR